MATKKASPAQLAARKKFAEMARSGAFKKRKNNPMHKYTVLHRGTANIAGEVMASGPQAAKQKVAEKLGIPTLAYLVAKKTNPAKKTVSQKISQLTHEGYPQKQAVAVALSEQSAGKVKKNPQEIIAKEQIITLGNNYFANIKLTSYNDYYVYIYRKYVETNGFVSNDVVPDYKPRIFVREKSAVASVMRYATKNLKTNPTKQRKTKPTAVMANPVKNKQTYTVSHMAPGQSINNYTKLATFYNATDAKKYAIAHAKINKSHYVRVESHG